MENAPLRRKAMETHLNGIEFESLRIPATDTHFVHKNRHLIDLNGSKLIDPVHAIPTWYYHIDNKYISKEVAVTISHLRAIQRAYQLDLAYALILEDDARISDRFLSSWNELIESAPDDWEMLNLYTTNRRAIVHLNHLDDLHTFWSPWYWGSTAYVITRVGMEKNSE